MENLVLKNIVSYLCTAKTSMMSKASVLAGSRHSFYYICDAKGKTLKTMSVSNVGEIVGVSNSTITSRNGSWIFTWNKDGKKISARSAH